MRQSLPVEPQPEAVLAHQMAVMRDGLEMRPARIGFPPRAHRDTPAALQRGAHTIKDYIAIIRKINHVFSRNFCAYCLQGRHFPCPFVSCARQSLSSCAARSERACSLPQGKRPPHGRLLFVGRSLMRQNGAGYPGPRFSSCRSTKRRRPARPAHLSRPWQPRSPRPPGERSRR